jgi:membrane dipeptidase
LRTLRLPPVLLAGLLLPGMLLQAQTRTVSEAEVQRVHRAALLIDSHNDVPYYTVQGRDIASPSGSPHTSIAGLKTGGVGGLFFSIWVAKDYVQGNRSANRALQLINSVRRDVVEKHSADFMLATSVKDIEEAHRQGKIAALMGIEGGHAIEDSLRVLGDFYDLGVRYMTLTHTNTNNWADSSGDITRADVKHHDGLTSFGKDVVREMNRLGMLVDISHVSDKTFWDALEVSRAPIFASHSDARALANAPRNMTDEMIVALAKKGGVVDINFNCGFLSQRYRDALVPKSAEVATRLKQATAGKNLGELETDQVEGKIIAELGIKPATLADVVAHIDHIRKIAGIDAIGIGTDFNGVECVPQGLEDVSNLPNLTRALLEKGYKEDDIRKIYSGNFLRMMRAVEIGARK